MISVSNMLTAVLAGLALSSTADARRSRRSSTSTYTPPSPEPIKDFHTTTTSSSTSTAKCNATVSAHTTSTAVSSFKDVYATISRAWCYGHHDALDDPDVFKGKVEAIANLVLESKLKCSAEGKHAYACGGTWVDAISFAGAAYESYASAWADVKTDDELYSCRCDVDVDVSADAAVAAWGEIWAEIWARLDDFACVSTGDKIASDVDRTKVVDCVSTVIFEYMSRAYAKVWFEGDCYNHSPAECDRACCLDDDGKHIVGCECKAWHHDCVKTVRQYARARAEASISGAVTTNTAECKTTVKDKYAAMAHTVEYTPPADWASGNVADTSANTTAFCEAIATGTAEAEAVSASASATARLVKSVCSLHYGPETVMDPAKEVASAVAKVYNRAWGECELTGADADPTLDGGCAISKSYSKAAAEACAEAISVAVAGIDVKTECGCDASAGVLAGAIAHEIETILAFAEQRVEAHACISAEDGYHVESLLARECIASSVADLTAKAVASVLLKHDCVEADKSTYCFDKCKDVNNGLDAYDPDYYATCLQECSKQSDLDANAFVSALATIDLTTQKSCKTQSELGRVWGSEVLDVTKPISADACTLSNRQEGTRYRFADKGCTATGLGYQDNEVECGRAGAQNGYPFVHFYQPHDGATYCFGQKETTAGACRPRLPYHSPYSKVVSYHAKCD